MALKCSGPGCDRFAPWGTLCDSHFRQAKAGRPLTPLRKYVRHTDVRAYLLESAERFAAAKVEREREVALCDLLRAAESWGRRAAGKAT